MVTMSVRGTMISRTTVSPKSMIDSIRSRSDSSITECSMASSARARISSSVTNGPFFRPLPGRMMLATPMSARAGRRSTQPANSTIGAVSIAARSVCCSAHVFGAASAITNSTSTFNTMPIATPRGTEQAGGEHTDEGRLDRLDDVDRQVDRVEVALEVLDDAQHPPAAPWAGSARARPHASGSCG